MFWDTERKLSVLSQITGKRCESGLLRAQVILLVEKISAKTKFSSIIFGFLSSLFVLFCKKYPAKLKKLHYKCTEDHFVENKLSWKNLLLWHF